MLLQFMQPVLFAVTLQGVMQVCVITSQIKGARQAQVKEFTEFVLLLRADPQATHVCVLKFQTELVAHLHS
jgi:hypothetical protein